MRSKRIISLGLFINIQYSFDLKTHIFKLATTDKSSLATSLCFEHGKQENIMIVRLKNSDGFNEYVLPSISIIPPFDVGCYVDLKYNGNIIEDRFYISKEKQTKSRDNKWIIVNVLQDKQKFQDIADTYNRDHYMIYKTTTERADKLSGKNKN